MLFKATAPAAPAGGDMVIARLNVRAQPLDRGEAFEDPLEEILQATGTGRVTGGGTMLGEEGEIESCDLEITLPEATDAAIGALRRALEGLGAPRGSKLIWNDGANELAFGTLAHSCVTFRPKNDAETTPMRHRFGPKRQSNRGDGKKAPGRKRLA